jgi:hypothetical protein
MLEFLGIPPLRPENMGPGENLPDAIGNWHQEPVQAMIRYPYYDSLQTM